MSRKIILFLLSLTCIIMFSGAIACAQPEQHEHQYSSVWSMDETYHWHNATCVHLNKIKDKEKHDFDGGVKTPATYDSEGYITYTCQTCGYEKVVAGDPILEHKYSSDWTFDDEYHWHACTDEGYTHLIKDKTAHDDANEVIIRAATEDEVGLAQYTCSVCNHTYEKEVLIQIEVYEWAVANYTQLYVGQTLSSVALTGGSASIDGQFKWKNEYEIINSESASYAVIFVPTESDKYQTIESSITLSASYLTVTITVGENGTASSSGVQNVTYGGEFTVEFTPNSGYTVESITVNGEVVSPTFSYTLSGITENSEITVIFCEYDTSVVINCLSGSENCYQIEQNCITFAGISEDSVYSISGEFDGNIVIDVGESYNFDLELHGLTLSSGSVSPIIVLSANNATIVAKNGYVNYVNDLRSAVDSTDETQYSASIYSLADLKIQGKGSLQVTSENNNGIHTKDDLEVKNLTLSVTCVDNALKGNDSVTIESGQITLISTKGDGIKSTNSHISDSGNQKGTVSILGGTINIYAACDGIDSAFDVIIDGEPQLNIYTDKYSEYSEDVTVTSQSTYYLRYSSTAYKYSIKYYNSDSDYLWVNVSDSYETVSSSSGRPGGSSKYYYYTFAKHTEYAKLKVYMYSSSQTQGQEDSYYACSSYVTVNTSYDTIALSYRSSSLSVNWTTYSTSSSQGGGMDSGNSDKGEYSTKGIKSANEIVIKAGIINITSYDDSIHANNDGGTLENGNTPLGNITISGGTLTIYSNDDGIHADGVTVISGGTVAITNSYEGIEGSQVSISGGDVSVISSDDGLNGTGTSGTSITLSGGTLYVKASGDGVDSNSTTSSAGIIFSGTDAVIISNSNGNAAIDSEKGYTYSGGRVLAVASTGGMSSENTNCSNFSSIATSKSASLSSGQYITVSVSSTIVVTLKMPVAMSATVIYLGSSSATISTSSSSSANLDASGVCWN